MRPNFLISIHNTVDLVGALNAEHRARKGKEIMRKKQIASKIPLLFLLIVFQTFFPKQTSSKESSIFDLPLEELMKIAIATKTEISMEEAPSIVSVITAREVKNSGARNLVDVLRTVPGFYLSNFIVVDGYKIAVRGFLSENKTKVMLNGHSIINMHKLSVYNLFHRIPLEIIKRIEIIRGPGSALYGTGAFTGVINIITQDGGDNPSRVSIAGGSHDTIKPSAELSLKKDQFDTYIFVDNFKTDGYDGRIESDLATFLRMPSAAPGKMTNKAEYTNIYAKVDYNNVHLSTYVQDLKHSDGGIGVAKALTDENDEEQLNGFIEIGYNVPLVAENMHLTIKAFYDYSDDTGEYEIFPEEVAQFHNSLAETQNLPHARFPPGVSIMGTAEMKGNITGGEIAFDSNANEGVQIVTGLTYEQIEMSDIKAKQTSNTTGQTFVLNGTTYPPSPYVYLGGFIDVSDVANWKSDDHLDRSICAVYAQFTFDLKEILALDATKALAITTGIRYDDYDDVGSTTNPRIGLVYTPVEKLYFKILYGTAFRAPDFVELYDANNAVNIGNTDLSPEEIATFEGLIGYNFTKNIRGTLNFFNIRAKELIKGVTAGGSAQIWENVGKMESVGAEAEIKFIFDESKSAYCNLTYQDVKNTTNEIIEGTMLRQDDYFPGSVPEFFGSAGVDYGFTRNIITNVSISYIGEIKRNEKMMWDGTDLIQIDQRDPVEVVTLFNASVTFKHYVEGLELQLSGFNLFNEDHRDPEPDGVVKYDYPHTGTTFMARVSYSF